VDEAIKKKIKNNRTAVSFSFSPLFGLKHCVCGIVVQFEILATNREVFFAMFPLYLRFFHAGSFTENRK